MTEKTGEYQPPPSSKLLEVAGYDPRARASAGASDGRATYTLDPTISEAREVGKNQNLQRVPGIVVDFGKSFAEGSLPVERRIVLGRASGEWRDAPGILVDVADSFGGLQKPREDTNLRVSRFHAVIEPQKDGSILVRDTDSKHGTEVYSILKVDESGNITKQLPNLLRKGDDGRVVIKDAAIIEFPAAADTGRDLSLPGPRVLCYRPDPQKYPQKWAFVRLPKGTRDLPPAIANFLQPQLEKGEYEELRRKFEGEASPDPERTNEPVFEKVSVTVSLKRGGEVQYLGFKLSSGEVDLMRFLPEGIHAGERVIRYVRTADGEILRIEPDGRILRFDPLQKRREETAGVKEFNYLGPGIVKIGEKFSATVGQIPFEEGIENVMKLREELTRAPVVEIVYRTSRSILPEENLPVTDIAVASSKNR